MMIASALHPRRSRFVGQEAQLLCRSCETCRGLFGFNLWDPLRGSFVPLEALTIS